MAGGASTEEVPDISTLKVSETSKSIRNKKPAPVADSWEDDIASSSEDESAAEPPQLPKSGSNSENESNPRSAKPKTVPLASSSISDPYDFYNPPASSPTAPDKRPEKSIAVVNRLIAGSLGIRVKRTEEQRRFDRNQIENERKRRDEEKRKMAEAESQKRSVWDD